MGVAGLDAVTAPTRPNIIFIMTDDQGWGDVGFNGHPILRTPHLDSLAREGVRLDRFYAAAPVCSPTRASSLTGRHPSRYRIDWAYGGPLPAEETTVATLLRDNGYRTALLGKWHLGQLSRTLPQGRRHTPDPDRYAPPWERGFEVVFATEGSVPTFNPYYYIDPRLPAQPILEQTAESLGSAHRWPQNYWTGSGRFIDEPLTGDDSEIIMDRALEFIRESREQPFFACIWFHTPHTPIASSEVWRALYPDRSMAEQHWLGSLSAMDAQVGRLRAELISLGVAEDTIIFFCSDNGPSYVHSLGSAGPFNGRKGSLQEGGIRVPALVYGPAGLRGGRVIRQPLSTSDLTPTFLHWAGMTPPADLELDGENVALVLAGHAPDRIQPIYFHSPLRNPHDPWPQVEGYQAAVQWRQFKLLTLDSGSTWSLFNLDTDPSEESDLSASYPDIVGELLSKYGLWRESCLESRARE
jgi:arylsulfatase A-like enzyme